MPLKPARSSVLIACAVAIFWPGAFIFGFPGVLRQYWQQAFAAGGGSVGGTVSFMLAGATCFMYLCGRWQEKIGPGRLAAIGSVLCGSSVVGLSWAGNMIQVNIWAFAVGASSAFVYLPGLTVVQHWYPERRGLVAGIFNMSFGLSAAIMSPLFVLILTKWGVDALTSSAGWVALIVGAVASSMIRFPETETPGPASPRSSGTHGRRVADALTSREFWCLWFTWMLAGAAGASMLVLATGFGLANGLNLAQAVLMLTAFNLTNGCGRLISGYVSDHLGRSSTMAISFLAAGMAYLILPHMVDLWIWAVLAAIIGFAFGTMFAVSGPLAGDCFGMTHFGAIFGLIFTAYGFVAGPLGPWLSGHILDVTQGNYTIVFTLLGCMYVAAAGLILLVRPWRECRL